MSKITVRQLQQYKLDGRKIAVLTAYDYPMARIFDDAGIDMIHVGDSLGNVVQGRSTTLPVTLDQMIYHAEMVVRAVEHAFVVVDLPFPCGHLGVHDTVAAAAKILKESGAQAVKLEGGAAIADQIAALVQAGIPVFGHCGMLPQTIHQMGGYRIQRDREQLLADVQAVEAAGAFAVVLECVPEELAAEATQTLRIPTIGIGAGPHCDGQVLVAHDMLGYTAEANQKTPKHAKVYAQLHAIIHDAAEAYIHDVRRATEAS